MTVSQLAAALSLLSPEQARRLAEKISQLVTPCR
jgi:hypothetical protein